MAKVDVKGLKGKRLVAHAVYDFAVDGGVKDTALDLFDLEAGTIIHDFWLEVETAVVGTTSTLEVGVTGGDTDGFFAQMAEGALLIDYISSDQDKGALLWDDTNDHSIRKKYTAAEEMSMLIGTNDLTAGKVHFYVEYSDGY